MSRNFRNLSFNKQMIFTLTIGILVLIIVLHAYGIPAIFPDDPQLPSPQLPVYVPQIQSQGIRYVSSPIIDTAPDNESMAIAEWQYFTQKGLQNRPDPIGKEFSHFEANYPCFWGEHVVGVTGINDGNKYVCGIQHLTEPCVVYSFGSSDNFHFESGVLRMAPFCKIFTFDPFSKSDTKPTHPNIQFLKWGLKGNLNEMSSAQSNLFDLFTIMEKLNHTHIDILKMDIEGYEWNVFQDLDRTYNETGIGFPSFGQLQVELHLKSAQQYLSGNPSFMDALLVWFSIMDRHQLRLFHKEINGIWGRKDCIEYAFIQRQWQPNIKNYTAINYLP